MARPKLPEDEKRQLHSFRLDPEDRKAVQGAAEDEGISFPAAAEKYVKAGLALYRHPAMDERTAQVLVDILDQLSALQQRNNGNRWWKTAKAWAAANEVFKSGPFARLNPDNWSDDEDVQIAWRAVSDVRESKREAISILQRLGIKINPDAQPGRQNALLGFFETELKIRKHEKEEIEAIEDHDDRATALAVFSIVEKSDVAEAEALELWREKVRPYVRAEMEGVELYKNYRRDVVREQTARGELPHYEDIL